MQDRYIKIMLTLVAGLLAANLLALAFQPSSSPAELFVSSAQAQNRNNNQPATPSVTVKTLKGFMVEDLKDVVALGDGKSFVVSNPKGFMVYQVAPGR